MDKITVREATREDLDALFEFEQGVIAAERPFDPTLKRGHIHYYGLENMIDDPNIYLVVAQAGDKIVGSGYARIEAAKPYLEHEKHSYLGFMYTLPEFRGKGINKLIIGALKAWSVSRNIMEMRLDVYVNNTPAIQAYEKVGFAKLMIEMRMGLDKE